MPTELTLIFTAANMQTLMDLNPDKIVVRTFIEEGTLEGGAKVGVIKVKADARQNGNPEPLDTISGCPCPPCEVE